MAASLKRRITKLEQATEPDDAWAGWSEDELRRYKSLCALSVYEDATEAEEAELVLLQRRVPQVPRTNRDEWMDPLTLVELRRVVWLMAKADNGGITAEEGVEYAELRGK